MIFGELQTVANVTKQIEKIKDVASVGTDGLFDSESVKSYVSELQGLTSAQAEASLTSAGLEKNQRKQILSALEASAATKTLTAGQIQERLATKLNSEEDAKALLLKSGIITQKELEENATIEVASAKLKEAVANGTLSSSDYAVIIGALGITGANTSETISFNVLTASIWANIKAMLTWLTTNPVGLAVLTIGALYGVIKAIDHYTTSIEEAKEITNDAIDSYSSITSEVENLENKLNDLNDQINNLDPITDAEDIENLKSETTELENQLAILKEKQRLAKDDANDAAKESLNRTITSRYESETNSVTNHLTGETLEYHRAKEVTRMDELQNAMDAYDEYAKQKADLEKNLAEMAKSQNYSQDEWDATEKSIGELDEKMQDARKHASELAGEINEEAAGLDKTDNANKDLLESTDSVIKAYNGWTNEINSSTDALNNNVNAVKDANEEMLGLLNDSATITSSIQQIASQLEPQFAKLGEAYKNIFTEEGFTLDNVDNSMLEDLRTTFAEIGEEIGVNFDSEKLEPFFDSLTNGTATSEQVQQSFNDLATAYFYSTNTLDNLNESTAESIQKQLEELGVANAKEVVYDTLNAKTEALALQEQFLADGKEKLVNASNDKATSFLEQAGASEAARKYLFMLVAEEKVFGSTELSTDEKIKELQKLAMAYGQTAIAAKIARRETLLSIDPTDPSISSDEDFLNEVKEEINNGISHIEIDFTGINHNAGKAGKEAGEEYKEALEKELSDLDTVLNFITDTIQDQIDVWNDAKDAAVSALEAERDAAIEALEAQKAAIQEKIDAKQKEIDKIKEAREERKAEIDLQQKQYELERLQNQKTIMTYKNGQVVYETDTRKIFEAREAVDEAKENIEILKIEKEISVLEEAIDNIDKQIDSINKHYDKLIKQTEAYYESLIKGMEEYKSRWEQIAEIEEQAKINVLLQELGITTDDVLNMSGEAFEQFKQRYLAILTEMYNGESEMISAINDVANGINTDKLSEGLNKTKENIDKLVKTDYATVTSGINDISTELNNIPSSEKFDDLTESFKLLAEAIGSISDALNGTNGVGGLISGLSNIASPESLIGLINLISQFNLLKNAVNAVSSAIGGGISGGNGSMAAEGGGLATGANGGAASPTDSSSNGGTGSLKDSLKQQVEEAKKIIPEEIALFNGEEDSLLAGVNDVIDVLTGGQEEAGEGEDINPETLMGANQLQYNLAKDIIPAERDLFNELAAAIAACVAQLQAMVSLMGSVGGGDWNMMGTVPINPKAEGTVGNAFAKGYNGLPHNEKNALRSEYGQPELTVYPDGTTELTTKPIMSDLPKGTVIFNEEQTRRIMNGKGSVLGKAFASGTYSPVASIQGIDIKSLQDKFLGKLDNIVVPVNSIDRNIESMVRMGNNIHTNNNASQDVHISIGDIQLQGVQDVNGLANAITTKLPNVLLQTITKRK